MALVKQFYQVNRIFIPRGVYDEIAETDLIDRVDETGWIHEEAVDRNGAEQLRRNTSSSGILGIGESEAIILAKTLSDSLLLISDRTARHIATLQGVQCVDIPGFLLACKMTGFLETDQIAEIIVDLEEKDYYKLPERIKVRLLQNTETEI